MYNTVTGGFQPWDGGDDYTPAPNTWTTGDIKYWKPETNITTLPEKRDFGKAKKDVSLTRDQRVKNKMKLIEALGDEVAKLKARPEEPKDYGDVVRFAKQFTTNGKLYDYAAILAGDGRWYVTGGASPQGLTWDQLLDFAERDGEDLEVGKAEKFKVMK